jgi:hypothetical protein
MAKSAAHVKLLRFRPFVFETSNSFRASRSCFQLGPFEVRRARCRLFPPPFRTEADSRQTRHFENAFRQVGQKQFVAQR